MDALGLSLVVAAAAYAVVHGINNGATLIVTALRVPGVTARGALAVAVLGVAVAPLIVGTAVAGTVADGFVTGGDPRAVMLVAVVVSSALTLGLSLLGIPMSLTLAFVGALVGAAPVFGLSVRPAAVVTVLVAALAAPALGALLSWLLLKAVVPVCAAVPATRVVAVGHWVGYPALCLAYGANDAQKVLAVAAVALGLGVGDSVGNWWLPVSIAVLFGVGAVFGAGARMQRTGAGIAPLRPVDAAVVELATAGAVFASVAVGTPVALAQAAAGAVLGSGAAEAVRRVRWYQAARIGVAWIVSFPSAALIGWVIAALAVI